MSPKRAICVGLLALNVAVFGHVCLCAYVSLDDPLYVTTNPYVLGGLTWENIVWSFTGSCLWAGYWFPLTWLSLQLDATLFGPTGYWGFHLVNLIFYVANTLLFFHILEQMTGDLLRSAAVAALFSVHPLRVESVAWITERKDMTSMFFLLLTVLVWFRYTQRPSWQRYGVVVLSYTLGLMSKPILITLPYGLLLLDFWPLGRLRPLTPSPSPPGGEGKGVSGRSGERKAALSCSPLSTRHSPLMAVAEKIPLVLVSVLMTLIDLYLVQRVGSVASLDAIPLVDRLGFVISGYVEYLEKTFWPVDLAVLYPMEIPSAQRVVLSAAVLLAISALALHQWRRTPALIVGWCWFLGTLVPVSGIIPIGPQGIADRYSYIPHLGLFIAIVWGVSALPLLTPAPLPLEERGRGEGYRLPGTVAAATVVALVVLLSVMSWQKVWLWQGSEPLFTQALSVTRNNSVIHHALAFHYDRLGKPDLAIMHMEEAHQIEPRNVKYMNAYARMLIVRGDVERAVKLLTFGELLEPRNGDCQFFLGMGLMEQGKMKEARTHLERALACWADRPELDFDNARKLEAYELLGDACLRLDDPVTAADYLTAAAELSNDSPSLHRLLGLCHVRLGRWQEAADTLARSLALDRGSFLTRSYLAFAVGRAGNQSASEQQYNLLLKEFPHWPAQAKQRIRELVANPAAPSDFQLAHELAQQVCEATKREDQEALRLLELVEKRVRASRRTKSR